MITALKTKFRRIAYLLYSLVIDNELRRFNSIKLRAKGMLPPETYRLFYQAVAPLPDLDIVEVGGAAGASSVALALGMKESGKHSKLIVVEKCEGGSRIPLGGYTDNHARIVSNLKTFNVWENVRLFPHYLTFENGQEVINLIQTPQIAGLVHDADGRVDRDFYFFWEHLIPHGLIIIDDCENKPEYKEISDRYPDGGTKKLTTYRMVQLFLEWRLIEIDRIERGTVFAHKPAQADFELFDLAKCQQAVEEIMQERDAYFQTDAP